MTLLFLLAAAPIAAPTAPGSPESSELRSATDAPVLTLVPSPESGSAPLLVNLSVAVAGGEAPYHLSVCFGTVDHQTPAPDCGVGASEWNGTSARYFQQLYRTPGNYSVTGVVTDSRGAGEGSTALIVVTPQSSLSATAYERTTSGTAPLSVTFNESVAGGTPPITLQWAFGDGSSGSELPGVPVVHVYQAAGTFTPTLTVTDGAGHRTTQVLGPITVAAPPARGPGLPGTSGGPSWIELGATFAVAAIAVGLLVRLLQTRRLRKEGNALIAELERDPRGRPPRQPAP
ncbi:MAG: PKD domain-containing protein [Thermoplasmata archaeon]|nr:PKD domain-containing protein [Thermoplasmata archaeon]